MNQFSRDRKPQSEGGRDFTKLTPAQMKEIIMEGNGETINRLADQLGKDYSTLTSSRLRKFFGGIERITEFDRNSLQLLRPRLAYIVGKEKDKKALSALKSFRDNIDACIEIVDSSEQFTNLKHFLEAIVAYHRFHGGKE